MAGALRGAGSEAEAAVRALAAGTDVLLYPSDLDAVARGVEEAVARGRLDVTALDRSAARIEQALERAAGPPAARGAEPAEAGSGASWALEAARRSVATIRGRWEGRGRPERVEVAVVDDDLISLTPETLRLLGLDAPPPGPCRDPFFETLAARGYASVALLRDSDPWSGEGEAVIACFADVRGYKGRAGLSREAEAQVARRLRHRAGATLVLFGHPRLAAAWPHARLALGAWSGDEVMLRAAAHRLADLWEGDGGGNAA